MLAAPVATCSRPASIHQSMSRLRALVHVQASDLSNATRQLRHRRLRQDTKARRTALRTRGRLVAKVVQYAFC
jgi:hypothetical protein